ncbi:MAG: hypothetical protein R3F53_15790 [Gammaproteobacteria bacterium]
MKLTSLKPFVPSGKDFALAKAFFLDIGFTENWGSDEICELQQGGAIFLLQNFHNEDMQHNYMLSVTTDNLDDFYAHLLRLDLDKKYPMVRFGKPEDRPWGTRELHLIDPAGVCWHFL